MDAIRCYRCGSKFRETRCRNCGLPYGVNQRLWASEREKTWHMIAALLALGVAVAVALYLMGW